jgi:hypothetical protein
VEQNPVTAPAPVVGRPPPANHWRYRAVVNAARTFTGTVSPQGLLPRNPDGSCSTTRPALHEVDMVAFSGTLSFSPRSDGERRWREIVSLWLPK